MPARRIVVGYTLKLVIGSFKKEALSALSTLQEERRRGTDTFILSAFHFAGGASPRDRHFYTPARTHLCGRINRLMVVFHYRKLQYDLSDENAVAHGRFGRHLKMWLAECLKNGEFC